LAAELVLPENKVSWWKSPGLNFAVGIIGTIVGIAGLIFAIQTLESRELVYLVNPARAIVVKTGAATSLHVFYGQQELKSDVTAVQIELWNKGKKAIHPAANEILRPIVIQTSPSVPILEATLRKKSRDVVDISLDKSHLSEGKLGVSWNILEHEDGGILQLVYAGSPDVAITVSGVLEGQRKVTELHAKESDMDAKSVPLGKSGRLRVRLLNIFFPTFSIALMVFTAIRLGRPTLFRRPYRFRRVSFIMDILFVIMCVLYLFMIVVAFMRPTLPMDF